MSLLFRPTMYDFQFRSNEAEDDDDDDPLMQKALGNALKVITFQTSRSRES